MVKYKLTKKGKLVVVFLSSFMVLSVTLGVSFSKEKSIHYDYNNLYAAQNQPNSKPQLQQQAPTQPEKEQPDANAELLKKLKVTVLFDANATSLSNKYDKDLNMVVQAALQYKDAKIQIEGNCATLFDNNQSKIQKSNNYNLSLKRAEAVANYLKDKGIDLDRLVVVANGSDKPLKDNNTPAGRKYNRRVDVFFVSK